MRWGMMRWWWVCLLIPVMALTGCSDDDPVTPLPVPDPPAPSTPDELMTNLVLAYENRNIELYLSLLHPAFTMELQEDTSLEFPDVGGTLDFAIEQRIHERMFSGDDLQDPVSGALVPGVVGISFGKISKLEPWQLAKNDDTNPEEVTCLYEVEILFERGQDQTQICVRGQIRFRAVSRTAMVAGEAVTYYQMSGQDDLTSVEGKGSECDTWGGIQCLYR